MKLGRAPVLLGYAGLLPAFAVLGVFLLGPAAWRPYAWQAGVVYALTIFAFLGGVWWSFALRAPPARQGPLLALSVLPALGTVALVMFMGPPAAVLLGGLHVAMLPADRLLERAGCAPAEWLRLRAPLALGLGLSTAALGLAGWRVMVGA